MKQRKLVLYIACSLDGYIATKDHQLDWLFNVEGQGDNGYSLFYKTVDTIVMGRVTYDWVMNQEKNQFPYKGKECFIFSRSKKEDTNDVTFVNHDIVSFVKELKKKDGKDIWLVSGGELLTLFLKEKLVDEMIVTIAPVLIGDGISLFNHLDFQVPMTLKNINRFNQFVELHYIVNQ